MKLRILSLATAAALGLCAFAGSPASAAAVAPASAAAGIIAAESGSLVSEATYRRGSHRRGWHHRHSRNRHGHFPRAQFGFHFGYPHAASCWRTHYAWTPWGYQLQRVWVCGRRW